MSKKLECEIVQDLLPMYVDQLTSDYTTQRIKEHLKECPPCHEIYDLMTDAEEKHIEHKKEAKKLKRYLKKIKLVHALMGVIIAFFLYKGIDYAHYLLFDYIGTIVESDVIEVTELYELENGWIYFTLHTTDLHRNVGYSGGKNPGELYISIERPLIPTKVEEGDSSSSTTQTYIIDPEKGFLMYYHKGQHFSIAPELTIIEYVQQDWEKKIVSKENEQLHKIYYQGRNENDQIMIWERGMDLPLLDE